MLTGPPRLETERLVLDGHAVEDFEQVAAMWADPAVVAGLGGRRSSREESWMRLLGYRGLWPLLGFGYWAVRARAAGTFVGDIGFADYHRDLEAPVRGVPEAGWVFAADWHGRGLASEALRAILDWLDRQRAHPRAVCLIDPENAASLRVAAKGGFAGARAVRFRDAQTLLLTREGVTAGQTHGGR